MARMFLTKVWGLSPDNYPALGFNTQGARHKFIRESSPGDWVVLAGTRSAPTPPEEQGRLLGMVQLGRQEIDVEEVLRSVETPIPDNHYLEDGTYRWPFGLPMLRALRFPDRPDLKEVLGSYLPGTQWASFALDLAEKVGAEAPALVGALRTEPIEIVEAPAIVRQQATQEALTLHLENGPGPTGPGPSTSRAATERTTGTAWAYLLELRGGSRMVYKVGYSSDVARRVQELNKGLVSAITGFSWHTARTQRFKNEDAAYRFEQELHAKLRRHLVRGENEIYATPPLDDIETEWDTVFWASDWSLND